MLASRCGLRQRYAGAVRLSALTHAAGHLLPNLYAICDQLTTSCCSNFELDILYPDFEPAFAGQRSGGDARAPCLPCGGYARSL